jgi:uncharacterized membrane protein YtjA (UPF0391 family)
MRWAGIFFVNAVIAALIGYGGIVSAGVLAARILCFGFLGYAALMLVAGLTGDNVPLEPPASTHG